MKTQEEYAREIDEIVRRDVESCQIDWFKIDKEIFMLPEKFNCYENDMLTAGCHRIAYSEMEGVARQLRWD